ncbi:HAD family hydrolase [Streptomyces echinatus]
MVRRPLGNHHDGPDTLLVTSDAKTRTEQTANEIGRLRSLIEGARVVLWDFDGPICRLFARHKAERVAAELVDWLAGRGLHDLLGGSEHDALDPHAVLRAVDLRRPGSDLVAELEERLTQEELKAAGSAWPTAYADPLIRTWTATGSRLAITTNNSPKVVRAYLDGRGLTACFAPPHLRPHDRPAPAQARPALPQPGPERDGLRALGGPDDRRLALRPRRRERRRRAVPRLRA